MEKWKAHLIIHSSAAGCATLGALMAQAPGSDIPALQAIEIAMVIALGKGFGVSLDKTAAKGIIAAAIGTIVGRGFTQATLGWIPVAGNVLNASTAAAVVESLGWAVYADFKRNESPTAA